MKMPFKCEQDELETLFKQAAKWRLFFRNYEYHNLQKDFPQQDVSPDDCLSFCLFDLGLEIRCSHPNCQGLSSCSLNSLERAYQEHIQAHPEKPVTRLQFIDGVYHGWY